jgi:hypothetical protein
MPVIIQILSKVDKILTGIVVEKRYNFSLLLVLAKGLARHLFSEKLMRSSSTSKGNR